MRGIDNHHPPVLTDSSKVRRQSLLGAILGSWYSLSMSELRTTVTELQQHQDLATLWERRSVLTKEP